MSIQQPLFSFTRLVYTALTRKKTQLEDFKPFSIVIDDYYCSQRQLETFSKAFGDPCIVTTYAFVTSFKATLQCLAQAPIPSSLLGLIHLNCTVESHKVHNWYLPSKLVVSVVSCDKSEKGIIYQVVTEFYQQGELTITNTNTMLDKDRSYNPVVREAQTKTELNTLLKPIASWAINLKTSWSYARLSGDFNPIHIHSFLAKKLGMKNVIIHGMFNAHQCLKELSKLEILSGTKVSIDFNKPCFIPNQVFVRQYDNTDIYGVFSIDGKDRYLKVTIISNSHK